MALNDTTPREGSNRGAFAPLGLRDFRLLLVGSVLANAAQWIQQVTLGWMVYDLTSSGTMLGTMNLVRSVATVGLAPAAGVAIDDQCRRPRLPISAHWPKIERTGAMDGANSSLNQQNQGVASYKHLH